MTYLRRRINEIARSKDYLFLRDKGLSGAETVPKNSIIYTFTSTQIRSVFTRVLDYVGVTETDLD